MIDFKSKFDTGLDYDNYLKKHGSDEQRRRWSQVYEQISLTDLQGETLDTFVREMHVLCLAGAWCGDCAEQCPILEAFSRACPRIHLRFVDRDFDAELTDELRICGGNRVPVVVLLSEDFDECARIGDRTLSRYRMMAGQQLGAACPTGLTVDNELLLSVTGDWLREFERVQLMLRLSPRLRAKHGDGV